MMVPTTRNFRTSEPDRYAWMSDASDPRVATNFAEESRRFEEKMAPVMPLANEIFDEIVARIPASDRTVPYRLGAYEYWSEWAPSFEHPLHFRRRLGSVRSELIFDVNDIAGSSAYADVQLCVNPQSSVLAFAVDLTGNRVCSVRFKNLESGQILPFELPLATGNMAWTGDGRTLFYAALDPETLRSYRVKRYDIGARPESSVVVFEEADAAFSCFVYTDKAKRYVFIRTTSGDVDEVRFASAPFSTFKIFQNRRAGLEYDVQHNGSTFVIRTNLRGPNFGLMAAQEESSGMENWIELASSEPWAFLEDFEVFRSHVAIKERVLDGLRLRLVRLEDLQFLDLEVCEEAFSVEFLDNPDPEGTKVRYSYSTFTRPTCVIEYDLHTGERVVLKQDVLEGAFDPSAYVAQRRFVSQPDGTDVPLSVLFRRGRESQANSVLLCGYGAYGISIDPVFSLSRLSLLDRGFAIAIAHVRGGGELGRMWHDAGRLHRKPKGISDFIGCAEYLLRVGLAEPGSLFAMGESAGGCLVAAAINQHPELFRGAVAISPFVDVLNALSDETLPLTTTDYVEWGDPMRPDDRACIRSYSPYENIRAQAYPAILTMVALQDTQVPAWQGTKWLSRIRDCRTDAGIALLRADVETGHAGPSGRFAQFWDTALVYAFLIVLSASLIEPDGSRT
jgi:oligopeptidase B